jgi:hypothetical protein
VNKVYPDLTKENYKKVIPDITTLDVKEKVGDLMKACGVNTGMAKAEFLIDLSQKVMSNTAVYKELKEIIFN